MEKFIRHVADLADEAKKAMTDGAKDRKLAMEYYNGMMTDLVPDEGRTGVVSRDVRAMVKSVLPSVMRTVLGNDEVVKFSPVTEGATDKAAAATEYFNYVVIPEGDVEKAIFDACHDAILLKTGILKWSAYRETKVSVTDYKDQPDDNVLGILDGDESEILDYEEFDETDDDTLALNPDAKRHTFKHRQTEETTTPKLEAIPRDQFIMTPGAREIDGAELVGQIINLPRSDFVSMGYDKTLVWQIGEGDNDSTDESDSREGDDAQERTRASKAAQKEIEVFEVYVRIDTDGDGISELHRVMYGRSGRQKDGETDGYIILGTEMVKEAPYADLRIEREPHQFEGRSIYEDGRETQRIKTVLLRGGLDNIVAVNNPTPAIDVDALVEPENAFSTEFGKAVLLKAGRRASEALQWMMTPFVANYAFAAMDVIDDVGEKATGITDASSGLDASSFQNVSATAAHLASESGIAQADAIVRTLARGGLRKAFRGLLKLVIAHTEGERGAQINNEWKSYNPQEWDGDMDCVVNVGLGGGTKERDMSTLGTILSLQEKLIASMGADNPFVKPDQLYNTLEKITETAGFPSAQPFFTKPDLDEIEQKLTDAKNQPNPETEKIKAQFALEDKKIQGTIDKEVAQMNADLATEKARSEAKSVEAQNQLVLQREKINADREIALAKIEADLIKSREMRNANAAAPVPDILQGGLHG